MKHADEVAEQLLGTPFASLDRRSQKVVSHVVARRHIAKDTSADLDAAMTFGQRAADRVASFGGSWPFIIVFGVFMVIWVAMNSFLLVRGGEVFDPYPYILLNLFLSMLAAIQAPIILMSQNRQSEKDRLNAGHDYEVNLKAELEIMLLHEKVDLLRESQWRELLALQKEQLDLLASLIDVKKSAA
ncbi:MAG: DUF1003 domain-containing protein [Proteobacteria bacterium]|nr:DUF1003 domain-containing protein [Pseudomonadota bacterium]